MTGAGTLRPIRSVLHNPNGSARERLHKAAAAFEEVWLVGYASWPLRFQLKADMIRASLAKCGTAERTVKALGDADVHMLIEQFQRFCDEADRAKGEGRPY